MERNNIGKQLQQHQKTLHHFCPKYPVPFKKQLLKKNTAFKVFLQKNTSFSPTKKHIDSIQETQAKPNSCVAAKENVMPDSRGVANNRGSEAKLLEA